MKPAKLDLLQDIIASYGSAVVAFSGGCDSALVAKVTRDILCFSQMKAVTAKTPSLPENEIREVEMFVRQFHIDHAWIETRELENPSYAANPVNRCYFCKTELYDHLVPIKEALGFKTILNGTNQDDLSDWRPGLHAAKEHEVKSPLVEAGLTKQEVRDISRYLGLPTWDKPAAACLSSRIPHGNAVTAEKLKQIDLGEALLKSYGFRVVRLRHFGTLAKIEVGADEMARFSDALLRDELFEKIRELGFETIELDPEGYRQGKLNPSLA